MLGLWLAVSLVCGAILFVLTRNLWLGCFAQLLVMKCCLRSIVFEPMHPGNLICLLLACLAATPLLLRTRPRLALALQGGLAAGLLLIKINLGAFALIALLLSCAATLPDLARRRAVLWSAAAVDERLRGVGIGWLAGELLRKPRPALRRREQRGSPGL